MKLGGAKLRLRDAVLLRIVDGLTSNVTTCTLYILGNSIMHKSYIGHYISQNSPLNWTRK